MKLLYYADGEPGGLANYAVHQAAALYESGAEVTVLGLPHLRQPMLDKCPDLNFIELYDSPRSKNKWIRGLQVIPRKRRQIVQLSRSIEEGEFNHVLLSAYAEYFSPFWAGILNRQHQRGVRFGVIVHDPVRDFQVGPKWWHRWSIEKAYSFIDVAFVHGIGELDAGKLGKCLQTTVIPHGPYHLVNAELNQRIIVRNELGIQHNSRVWLVFGHIRDSKNLDLAIRALTDFPDDYLLVVGRAQSTGQRPIEYYQKLAESLGVSARCRWINDFVPDSEVSKFFQASDVLLLLYSKSFHSASGVLNHGVQFELPVVASGGSGPLIDCVQRFDLGVCIQPDSLEAVVAGIHALSSVGAPEWNQYKNLNSWKENANLVLQSLNLHNRIPMPYVETTTVADSSVYIRDSFGSRSGQ